MSAQDLVSKNPDSLSQTELQGAFPAVLARAGKAACFAADEFFRARRSNAHTRTAYAHQVTPGLAGRFLDEFPYKAPTKNQALAALRHFFDVLVARHAMILNPFHSVRGVRHPFGEGRTPEASVKPARQLLASIRTQDVHGLRDRAVLGTLIYTGARVGAISWLRIQDLRDHGNHRALQFSEKGAKSRGIPVRHDLDEWITDYLEGAGLAEAPLQRCRAGALESVRARRRQRRGPRHPR